MEIHQLQYFITLCEEKNYTAAARKCYISRQALRQSVQTLENQYGVELIRNDHNHLSVTPEGNLMYEHAKKIMEAYQEMNKSIYATIVEEQPLRLGISRSLVPFYSPEMIHELDRLCSNYPGIRIERTVRSADHLLRMMNEGSLDCAIVVDSGEPDHPYRRLVLEEYPMTVFLSVQHPLAQKASLTLQDLDRQHLQVMSRPDICFSHLLKACSSQDVHPIYEIVPDYYEVGYNVINKGYLAVDRYNSELVSSMDLDKSLPLEKGKYTMYTTLIMRDVEHIGIRILTAHFTRL